MAATAASLRLTMKEVAYLLFKKKICHKCGGKMLKERCSEIVDGSKVFTRPRDEAYLKRDEVNVHFYRFTCKHCGAQIELGRMTEK